MLCLKNWLINNPAQDLVHEKYRGLVLKDKSNHTFSIEIHLAFEKLIIQDVTNTSLAAFVIQLEPLKILHD